MDHEEENRVLGGLFEFFNHRVLSRTWALTGLFDVAWNNQEVTFCGWSEATDYFSNIEERVLELQPGAYSSVIAYVAAVEESYRAKAIESVRGPVVKYPFGLALLEAQRQLAGKWEQRRDLMYANQTRARPTKLAPTQPSKTPKGKSKGSGKNLKSGKLINVKEEDSGRPLQLRERGQNNEKAQFIKVKSGKRKTSAKLVRNNVNIVVTSSSNVRVWRVVLAATTG